MKERINADSQIILYAKNHFERKGLFEDLKVLVGERCGLEPRHVDDSSIFNVVFGIALPFIMKNPEYEIKELISTALGYGERRFSGIWKGSKCSLENVVQALMGMISIAKVCEVDTTTGKITKTIIHLDEPDYDLLPPSKNAKERMEIKKTKEKK